MILLTGSGAGGVEGPAPAVAAVGLHNPHQRGDPLHRPLPHLLRLRPRPPLRSPPRVRFRFR